MAKIFVYINVRC